ncbi:hypothetical protein JXA47_09245 [Candidatus Sumerlaeota bacterium]|nr:hypothetical protein [Candidatus Sumerlaeota bacterium]
MTLRCSAILLILATCHLVAQPTLTGSPASGEQMRFDPTGSGVAPSGDGWEITVWMQDDNDDTSLPDDFRRWWHFQVEGLDPAGETLHFRITNAPHTEIILPAWSRSTDGETFGDSERVPLSGLPAYVGGGVHEFTLTTDPGVVAIRVAKYFPHTLAMHEAFRASVISDPRLTEEVIGTTAMGLPIRLWTITDPSTPSEGKRRVWVHAAVHPSETTAHFTAMGLVEFLLSGEPMADALLQSVIFNIVPMANPDGVSVGNYRTTSTSVELERQWTPPYDSTAEEIVAMRTKIEELMGTVETPGSNPIEILLNLHSAHSAYPFHFRHVPNFNIDGTGVIPEVHDLEQRWIDLFMARSPDFVGRGATSNSTLGNAQWRPFVESMMHDRWSSDPEWSGPLVMAITFEGTYFNGPGDRAWNTPDDYRDAGHAMGLAIADFFEITVPPTGVMVR